MQGLGIGRGMNAGDGNPQPMTSSRSAAGDLTAVGDQDFREHRAISSVITF
jgi:hypothetical protein